MTHTSTEQPEALRLAEYCDNFGKLTPMAKELRRLHACVQELEASQAQCALLSERIYTYKSQPMDNVTAWRFGEASATAKPGGDYIDRGLSLLQQLEEKGYGIVELAARRITQEKQG